MNTPHITVTNLTMAYGDFVIQRDLSFTIDHGRHLHHHGRQRLRQKHSAQAFDRPATALQRRCVYERQDFWHASDEERVRIMRRIGVLYQSGALFSSLTLAENIALPLGEFTELSEREIGDIVSYKLALVGLTGFEDYYPSELSGGMQKRAGLARAMALDPEILFFDEPSAGLDPVSAKLLDDLIVSLRDTLGTTIVVVTHELASIFAIGTNSVFLDPETKTMLATGAPKKTVGRIQRCQNHSISDPRRKQCH